MKKCRHDVHKLNFNCNTKLTIQNLIMTTPRTSCLYSKPKIYEPDYSGRTIVSACSWPTELIYLDSHSQITTFPYLRQQPCTWNFPHFQLLRQKKNHFHYGLSMEILNNERPVREPSSKTLLRPNWCSHLTVFRLATTATNGNENGT